MTHTPGPWRAAYDRRERKHSFVGDGMWFAKVSWTVTSERNEADARLIAAAPELLEALKKIEAAGLGGFLTPGLCAEIVTAAIAKATQP